MHFDTVSSYGCFWEAEQTLFYLKETTNYYRPLTQNIPLIQNRTSGAIILIYSNFIIHLYFHTLCILGKALALIYFLLLLGKVCDTDV
jgi:succinate-acetate transporter protein